ncbi:MAG TPA: hypothetical protein PJ990_17730, partial [Saprospiraceae bacterium]|nr:hypothetical protein [Saprospiraceae bacterium]
QKGKYQSIEKGYVSGQYYLLGNKDCIPFTIQGDSNFILKEQSIISRKKYNEIFDGIVFFKDSMLIKKVVSQHGNMLDIYAYNTKNYNRKLLYNIFNEKNAKDANRNYNIIKSIYLRNLKAPDDRDIDYGIERLDITKDPNWKGDIKDLIVHNDQLSYVSNFQVATQGINFDTKIDGRNFLILDNVHNILSNYDLANLKLKTQIIFPESKTNFNFVLSNFNICINNEINYFCWDEIYRIWHRLNINVKNIYYPKRKILIGNHVFVLGRRSIDVVHNQVFMLKYNDL